MHKGFWNHVCKMLLLDGRLNVGLWVDVEHRMVIWGGCRCGSVSKMLPADELLERDSWF